MMKTTFKQVAEGKRFFIPFAGGRTIFYVKQHNKKSGNNAAIVALDCYSNNADRACIGNEVKISDFQLVHELHNQ